LLVKPLGEGTNDPNVSLHGGETVFSGRTDEDYVALQNWIIGGVVSGP
jgi:hypothetical protein